MVAEPTLGRQDWRVAHAPSQLPADLPVPPDDGAADHLRGTAVPAWELPATTGDTLRVDRPLAGARRVWYPVFPPDRHAAQVIDWLRAVV